MIPEDVTDKAREDLIQRSVITLVNVRIQYPPAKEMGTGRLSRALGVPGTALQCCRSGREDPVRTDRPCFCMFF